MESTQQPKYDVRCFKRTGKGSLRHGIWIMTGVCRGMFIHGDRNEIQAPVYSVDFLEKLIAVSFCEEITPEQVLVELNSWPDAVQEAQRCFDRHVITTQQ